MYKNRKISLLVAFSLIVSTFTSCMQVFAEQLYTDVDENHWAYASVKYMKDNNYISGYPEDGSYRPGNNITRAEFVTILNKIKGTAAATSNPFTDNNAGDWYYDQINAAAAGGYLTGYGDGTVRPNGYITREEAAVIVAQAYNAQLGTSVSYTDAEDISAWALPYVAALTEYEVLSGYEDGSFRPQANMQRAEVAVLFAAIENTVIPTIAPATPTPTVPYASLPDTIERESTDSNSFVLGNIEAGNTSGVLVLDLTVEDNTAGDFTVTYTKDGEEQTVTAEELSAVTFTEEEFAAANFTFNFANPTETSSATITVSITDDGTEIASKVYEISFGAATPSPSATARPSGGLTGGGSRPTSTPTPTPPFEERDRVVEALQGYQSGNYDVLAGDTGYYIDMLGVILSNDGNEDFDTKGSQTAYAENAKAVLDTIIEADKFDKLRDINKNVIQYVIANNETLRTASIDTDTKKEYVLYFRAMVNVIDQAALAAIDVYGDDSFVGADAKFEEFSTNRAPQIIVYMFNNYPELTDSDMKNAIQGMALYYCTALFTKGQQDATNIKDQLEKVAADGLTYEEFIAILGQYLLTTDEMKKINKL